MYTINSNISLQNTNEMLQLACQPTTIQTSIWFATSSILYINQQLRRCGAANGAAGPMGELQ
jgi:hypothetical protein